MSYRTLFSTARAGRLAALLLALVGLLGTSVFAAADDQGDWVWSESGDYMVRRKGAPVGGGGERQEAQTVQALLGGLKNQQLKAFADQLKNISQTVIAGDLKGAAEAYSKLSDKVANQPVTKEDLAGRAALAALAKISAAEMLGLTGDPNTALRWLREVREQNVVPDVKALSWSEEGWIDFRSHSFSAAVDAESRGLQTSAKMLQPVIKAASRLFEGRSAEALADLKATFGKGSHPGQTLIYAAAAALVEGHLSEASQYLGQAKSYAAYLPEFYVVGGLLAVAGGRTADVGAQFAEGVRRELGRWHQNQFLAAVAELAYGSQPTGVAGLQANLAAVPNNYRLIGGDLLAAPTAENAQKALNQPAWWFGDRAYAPGGLDTVAAPAAPVPTAPASPPAARDDATPPVPESRPMTPAETLQPIQAPAPAGPPPEMERVSRLNAGVATYQSGLSLLRRGRVVEAETALRSAVNLHPGLAEAWFCLGRIRYLAGDLNSAYQAWTNAVRASPSWAEAVYSLAWASEQKGLAGEALRLYQSALELGLEAPLDGAAKARVKALGG